MQNYWQPWKPLKYQSRGCHHLWLEWIQAWSYVAAFKSMDIAPWQWRNRWLNFIFMTKQMNFTVSHVYQESNICTDKLADSGIQSSGFRGFRLWDLVPDFLKSVFCIKNHKKKHKKTSFLSFILCFVCGCGFLLFFRGWFYCVLCSEF